MTRYTVHYSGRVQGVGFRYTTVNLAEAHPVAGYVQNLPDGRVRLVAEGEPAALDAFLKAVDDALGRYVRSRHVDRSDATGEFGTPAQSGSLTIRH